MGDALTASDVVEALHGRYNKPSQGQANERYVCLEEARSGAGFAGNGGRCDFLAINTWQGRGMELIGHEVKVTLSDWKTELDKPEKAERFARYCRRWFVAVPADLAAKIKDEVPPAWGLISVSATGRTTEIVKATARTPEEVPAWWWVGWLAQIDRQHKRRLPSLVAAEMAGEREALMKAGEEAAERRQRYQVEQVATLKENADRVKAATGLDLYRAWSGDIARLHDAWHLVRNVPDLDGLVRNLRRTADALSAATVAPAPVGGQAPDPDGPT